MRKLILNLHLYGGLIASSYLVLYGVSSIYFNHEPFIREHLDYKLDPVTWEREIPAPTGENDRQLSEQVRDELGLMGWTPRWEQRRDDTGDLHFQITRPGRQYQVHLHGPGIAADASGAGATGAAPMVRATVRDQRLSVWSVIRGLHGLSGPIPHSRLIPIWNWFTEITTVIVVFACASGVYLFTFRRRERRLGYGLLTVAAATLGLMFYVWLVG